MRKFRRVLKLHVGVRQRGGANIVMTNARDRDLQIGDRRGAPVQQGRVCHGQQARRQAGVGTNHLMRSAHW